MIIKQRNWILSWPTLRRPINLLCGLLLPHTTGPSTFEGRSRMYSFYTNIISLYISFFVWMDIYRFISSVQQLWTSGETSFGLCLGLFKGDEPNSLQILNEYTDSNSNSNNNNNIINSKNMPPIRTLFANPPFKKAPILQQCLDTLGENDIAFMMDVDVTFDENILHRLRRYIQIISILYLILILILILYLYLYVFVSIYLFLYL